MRSVDYQALVAADASIDQAGGYMDARQLLSVSLQAVMTGTSSGAVKLQFSNDIVNPIQPKGAEPVNWSDITNATVTITGTAGAFAILKVDLCYQYIRAVYTHNNGSAGTITVNMKGLGF